MITSLDFKKYVKSFGKDFTDIARLNQMELREEGLSVFLCTNQQLYAWVST